MKEKFLLVALFAAAFTNLMNAQVRVDSERRTHVGSWPYGESQVASKSASTIYGNSNLGTLNMYLPSKPAMGMIGSEDEDPFFLQCIRGTEDAVSEGGKPVIWDFRKYVRTFFISADGSVYSRGGMLESAPSLPPVILNSSSDSSPNKNGEVSLAALDKIKDLQSVQYAGGAGADTTNGLSPLSVESSANALGRIGLPADLVEKTIPQAVRSLEDGSKGIYYSDIVAVLVDAANELNSKVADLTSEVEALKAQLASSQPMKVRGQNNAPTATTGTEATDGMEPGAFLAQNNPNPFNTETVIAYRLPDGTTYGSLRVYDLQGKQVRKFDLDGTAGEVTIQASELEAGMYLYTLLADGNEVDTRRMILTD